MTRRVPDAAIEATVRAWAGENLVPEGSLSAASYEQWAGRQAERPPSMPTVRARLGERSWAEVVLGLRDQLLELVTAGAGAGAGGADAEVEVPVRCSGTGRIRWEPRTLAAWSASAACGCAACKSPTVAEAHPDLVALLVDPADAARSTEVSLRWRCPAGDPTHRTTTAPARAVEAGLAPCSGCRARAVFHRRHPPGDVVPPDASWRPRSAAEHQLARAVRRLAPELDVRHGWGIALGPDDAEPSVRPALVLPGTATAVVLGDPGALLAVLDGVGWRVVAVDPEAGPRDETARRLLDALGATSG